MPFARYILPVIPEELSVGAFDFPRDYGWPKQTFYISLNIALEISSSERFVALLARKDEDSKDRHAIASSYRE